MTTLCEWCLDADENARFLHGKRMFKTGLRRLHVRDDHDNLPHPREQVRRQPWQRDDDNWLTRPRLAGEPMIQTSSVGFCTPDRVFVRTLAQARAYDRWKGGRNDGHRHSS